MSETSNIIKEYERLHLNAYLDHEEAFNRLRDIFKERQKISVMLLETRSEDQITILKAYLNRLNDDIKQVLGIE